MAVVIINKTGRKPVPVGSCMVRALSGLKRAAGQSGKPSESPDVRSYGPDSRELYNLGKLIYRWTDIAGASLADHTWPERLVQGRLKIVCSDSQWFQTLTFLRGGLFQNIDRIFPELKLKEIRGAVGRIPKLRRPEQPSQWPDWRGETDFELPKGVSSELSQAISRTRKKLLARFRAMVAEGWKPCVECKTVLVHSSLETCSACYSRKRSRLLTSLRLLLNESPWLSFEEVEKHIDQVVFREYDAVKSDLLHEACQRIELLLAQTDEIMCSDLATAVIDEMTRVASLKAGLSPDRIDFQSPEVASLMSPEWLGIIFKGEEETC